MDTNKEQCIRCGAQTEYEINTQTAIRWYFVEGAGQLCPECWRKVYRRCTPNDEFVDTLTLPLSVDIIKAPRSVKEMPTMPRPKGSKNKKTVIVENIDEKITAAEREIAELTDTLKTKKAYLKELVKAKAESAKIAAAKKAEEDKATILAAVEKSGKSVEEILEMLKGE